MGAARIELGDIGMAVAAAGLIAIAAWGAPPGLYGTAMIGGPLWLRAVLPLLMGAPMVLRRRAPLAMWIAIWAVVLLLSLLTGNAERGLAFTFVLLAAAYSLGAQATLRRAVAGLIVIAPVLAGIAANGGLALAFGQRFGQTAVALSALQLVAFWLAGVFVRARRQSAALAEHNVALRRQAERAAAAERARIARELHDIIAHHLSVVVLHAAGAQACGQADAATLAEIEHSGRQALTETRRLLGVLREPGERSGRAPQPGISELPALAGRLRAAGLEVSLAVDGDHTALPPAVNVSAYRIVQEALTNVLKHAGPARAEVRVGCADSAVTIEVSDDGPGNPARPAVPGGSGPAGGHGLAGGQGVVGGQGVAGMRERVAVFGGDLRAGPRPGGGFTVRARLPAGEPS